MVKIPDKGLCVPYMASAAWYRATLTDTSVRVTMPPRELCRTRISGGPGHDTLLLSVPIEGGARAVKSRPPETWQVSEHGRWRDVHLGAINAAYGSSPYFTHIFPHLREIIASETNFEVLTHKIHALVCRLLDFEGCIDDLRELTMRNPQRAGTLRRQFSQGVTYEISIFDVIFYKGPSAIFTLI